VKIGVTIPNGVPGIDAHTLVEWGVRAEACGFEMAATIDRIVYPTHEQLVTLAAIASATERIRLMTSTLIAPTRDPVLFAKQTATLDRLSGGRLVLGLSAGMRPDDFEATGTSFGERGKRFDAMLETIHEAWNTGEMCPAPVRGRVPVYFGTMSAAPRIVRRIARWGDGYIAVGAPQTVAPIVEAIRTAWSEAGRDGSPVLVSASYFSLGEDDEAERNVLHYYGDFFPALGRAAAAAMPRTPEAIRRVRDVYSEAGFDEFLFSAAAASPDQVERLAEALA
jgi:alkanesulfonate monooxygenase SsuD/methylene tetrahydromethanopterin reductase-like flavin-dependent oxidoreductase (luciferase family)